MAKKTPEQLETNRRWREANKEAINQRRRERYAADPQAINERNKYSYKIHRDKRQATNRQWTEEHPEATRVIKARYRQSHQKELQEKGRIYSAKRYAEDPEKARQLARDFGARHRERVNAKARQRRAENREALLEKQRLFRAEHPEYDKAWRKAHPEASQIKQARRVARKKNAPINDLTKAQWQVIKEHYKHRCVYCGRKMQRLTMDHITPLSKGGSHTVSNIVPACMTCNIKKSAGDVPVPVQPLLLLAT